MPWHLTGKIGPFQSLNLRKTLAIITLLAAAIFLHKTVRAISLPMEILMYPAGFTLMLYLVRKHEKPYIQDAMSFPPAWRPYFLCYLAALAASVRWFNPFFIIYTCLWVPLVEEFYFRGVFYPLLLRKVPKTAAVFLLALIFTLVHARFDARSLTLFILSLGYTLSYEATGNLWWPIMYHSFMNLLVGFRLVYI
ncbi:MAG: lysostaphin resistance A-like protein [Bacillota bacterium]